MASNKQDLKHGELVVLWRNYVAEGAVFISWIDHLTARLLLADGNIVVVNGSNFDLT